MPLQLDGQPLVEISLEDRWKMMHNLMEMVSQQHMHIAEVVRRVQRLEAAMAVMPEDDGRIAYDSGGD